jgi:glycosyltransferase involved in cell wall biosynthesis
MTGPSPDRPGGVATFVRGLLQVAPRLWPGLRPALFRTDKEARTTPGLLIEGLRLAGTLRDTLDELRPALLHLCCGSDRRGWGLREAMLQATLARRRGVPVLLHLHASGFEELWQRPTFRLPLRRLLAGVDAVAVLSPDQALRFAGRGIVERRLFVVPNGVQLGPMRLPRGRTITEESPLRLLMVGSVEQRKGIDDLLAALERLRRARGAVARVEVIGPPAAPARLLRSWQARGRRSGLDFVGPLPPEEVAARLAAADGLVLPSRAECLPFALLEAMAASRPVLATRTGSVGELLDAGAGELVEPGDVAGLAAALLRWVDHPGRRLDVAAAGWRRVKERHSVEASARAALTAWAGALEIGQDEAVERLTRAGGAQSR